MKNVRLARRAFHQTAAGWGYTIITAGLFAVWYGWVWGLTFALGFLLFCIVGQTIIAATWDGLRGRTLITTAYYRAMGVRDRNRRPFQVHPSDS